MAKYSNTIAYQIQTKLDATGLNQLQQQLSSVSKSFSELSKTDGFYTTQDAHNDIARIQQVQTALAKSFNTNLNLIDLSTFKKELGSISLDSLQETMSQTTEGKKAFNSMLGTIGQIDSSFKNISSLSDKIMNTFGNTVRWGVTASIFQTIQNSLYSSVDYVKELDTSLNNIQIVTGETSSNLTEWAKSANEAAAQLGASTTAFTDAAQLYAQNGYSQEDYTKLAELTTKVANVTQQSTSEVSEEITSLMAGYKMSIDEAEDALSGMATVAAASASDLGELATAEQKVASAASTLGVSQDELTAQLSTIISVTREAPEQVGNSLKTIYARLGDLSLGETLEDGVSLGDVSSTLEKVGVTVLDVNGDMRSMGDILEDLMTKWSDLSQAEQQALAVKLAGKYQYNNLMTLMNNSDMYYEQKNMAGSSQGALDEQQAIYMESLEAKIQKLQTTWEGFITNLVSGDDFKPAIDGFTSLIQGATGLTDALGGLKPVLTTVSGLMINSFSKNIAAGISNSLLNKERSSLLKQNENTIIELMGGVDTSDGSVAKTYLKNTAKTRATLTSDQVDDYNQNVKRFVDIDNEWVEAEAKLDEAFAKAQKTMEKYQLFVSKSNGKVFGKNAQDFIDKTAENKAIDTQIAQLEKVKEALNNEDKSNMLSQFSTSLQDIEVYSTDGSTEIQNLRTNLTGLMETVSNFNSVEELTETQTKALLELIQSLETELASSKNDIGEQTEMVAGLQENVRQAGVAQSNKQTGLKNAEDSARYIDRQSTIEGTTQAVAQVAQMAGAVQSLTNIGSIVSDDSLDGLEKFSSIVGDLVVSVPTLASSYSNLSSILKKGSISDAASLMKEYAKTTSAAKVTTEEFSVQQTLANAKLSVTSTAANAASKGLGILNGAVESLTSAWGLLTVGIAAAVFQMIQASNEADETAVDTAVSKYEKQSDTSSFDEAYATYKQTGEVTDELTSAAEDLVDNLDIAGGTAQITAGNFDYLADKSKEAADALESTANAALAAVDKDTSTYHYFDTSDFLHSLTNSSHAPEIQKLSGLSTDLLGNDTSGTDTAGKLGGLNNALAKKQQDVSDLETQIKETDSSNSQKLSLLNSQLEDSKNTVTEIQSLISQLSSAQSILKTQASKEEKSTNFSGLADKSADEIREELTNENGAFSYIAKYAKSQGSEAGEEYIANLMSSLGKFDTSLIDEKFSSRSENDINSIKEAIDDSKLSASQKVTLVGELDKNATLSDINKKIEELKSEANKVTIGATLDTTDLKTASTNKSSLQDLMDSYESAYSSNGGFTEDEAANLIGENSEYAKYLTKVGDVYRLNTDTLAAYTDATREQTKAMEELRGESVDMSEDSTSISQLMQQDGFDEDTWSDTLRGIQSINQELTNGDVSTNDFLDGLEDSFDTFADKCSDAFNSASESFDSFINKAENADLKNIANLLGDELYQGLNKATKQAQSGESSMADYTSSLKKAATRTKKLAQATGGLTDEQVSQIENAEDIEKATDGMSDAQKSAAKKVRELSTELESLDAASEYSSDIQSQYSDLAQVFDDTGTVVDSVKTNMGGIQEQYSGTISTLAQTVSTYCNSNKTAMENTATAIQSTGAYTYEAAVQLLGNSTDLGNAMQSNASVASAAMQGTMSSANSAISNIAVGISGILTALMSDVGSMDGTVTGEPELTEGATASITTGDDKTPVGSIHIPGFKMNIKGSGSSSSSVGSSLTAEGWTKGDTSYNADTDNWETTYTKADEKGGTHTQTVKASSTDQVKTASKMLGEGIEAFGLSMADYANKGSGGTYIPSSSGGGSGGSGGSGSSPSSGGSGGDDGGSGDDDYSDDQTELTENEIDRYEKVNAHLDDIASSLDTIADEQDRLTGQKYIENISKQISLLKEEVEWEEKKLEIEKQEAAEYKNILANDYGVTFNSDGFIENYADIYNQLLAVVNDYERQYNATTSKSAKDSIQDQIDSAQDRLDKFSDYIEKYDKLLTSTIKESEQKIQQYYNDIENLQIEAFNKRLEATSNVKDLLESRADFNTNLDRLLAGDYGDEDPYYDTINALEQVKAYWDADSEAMQEYYDTLIAKQQEIVNSSDASDAEKKWAQSRIDNYTAYKEGHAGDAASDTGDGLLSMVMKDLADAQEQYRQFQETGTSEIFGEDSAELLESLQTAKENAEDVIESMKNATNKLHESIMNEIDEIGDEIDERLEKFDNISDKLDSYNDIIQSIYGDEAYDKINEVLSAQITNGQNQVDNIAKTISTLESLRDAMEEGSDEWKEVNEKIEDAQEQLLETTSDTLDKMAEMYQNKITQALNSWTSNTSLGSDLDWVSDEWELINRNADQYLDDVNAAYNIQKLQSKYLDLLDNSNQLSVQNQITDQMNYQLDCLRKKDKLSQYDVDYANAQLEILQKRIALEDAQRNKSNLKLKRDNQGNYSYVYTANEDDVSSAQEDLLDSENSAYNLSKDQIKQVQDDSLSALQDAKDMLSQIWTDANLTIDQKTERTQTIIESLKTYLLGCSDDLSTAETNIINDFIGMCESLTDENSTNLQDVLEELKNGNNEAFNEIDERFTTSITTWLNNLKSFNTTTTEIFGNNGTLSQAMAEYQANLEKLEEKSTVPLSNMSSAIGEVKNEMDGLATSTEQYISVLDDLSGKTVTAEKALQEMNTKVQDSENSLRAFQGQYNDVSNKLVVSEREKADLQGQYKQLQEEYDAYKAQKEAEAAAAYSGGGGGGGDYGVGSVVGYWGCYYYDSWGADPAGDYWSGESDAVYIDDYTNTSNKGDYGIHISSVDGDWDLGWVSPDQLFDTGGYTGDWGPGEGMRDEKNGKMAILHSKELVLNADDTENILQAVQAVRQLTTNFRNGAFEDTVEAFNKYGSDLLQSTFDATQSIDQNVHIEATFPNVKGAEEIESALLSLTNGAIQYANRNGQY